MPRPPAHHPHPGQRSRRADDIFDDGMEYWWKGDRKTARRYFKRALKADPGHVDAHNHLAIDLMDRGRLADAERHLDAGLTAGEAHLLRKGRRVRRGQLENRPYLRCLGNLALVMRRRRRFDEALKIHRHLLELNPDDNQGARYLVGGELHHLGDLEGALAAYRKAIDEPGCAYGLALALIQLHRPKPDIGLALLRAFARNRYVPPMLLGEPWTRVDGFHVISWAERDCAADYVETDGKLWRDVPDSAGVLRWWWRVGPVRAWRARIDEITVALGNLPVGSDERFAAIAEDRYLLRPDHMKNLVHEVFSAP
jgi:tetratricopeptide (TPR) repeat protein